MPTTPPYTDHARRHLPHGSDIVGGGFIAYDFDNVGEWLYIKATGDVPEPPSSLGWGIILDADGVAITNSDTSIDGGTAFLEVTGGDTQDDVRIGFGGVADGAPFWLEGSDYMHTLVHNHILLDVFGTGADSGSDSELFMDGGTVTLYGSEALNFVANAGGTLLPFPVDFGAYSVQIAAGDATNFGTVILEAFDRQTTPAYTEFFVGYVDFTPNPYTYNGQTAQILGGQTFTIVGSDGSPIFQVDAIEQGGDIHIRTGTTVVADL